MSTPTPDRRPLARVGKRVGAVLAVIGAAASTLVTVGALTADQGSALEAVAAGAAGLITAVTVALTAFGVIRKAEPLVTPVDDPRTDDGTPLVPITRART